MRRIMMFLLLFMLAGELLPVFCFDSFENRTAIFVDSADCEFNVIGIGFYSHKFGFGRIFVGRDSFKIVIPLSTVISIDVKGKICEVRYQRGKQERTIFGNLDSGEFFLKTEFTSILLPWHKLKKLTFKENPHVMEEEKTPSYYATLVLRDGTKIPAANLLRVALPRRPEPEFEEYADIQFLIGESEQIVSFEDIKTIEFGSKNEFGYEMDVTITLKNGRVYKGKLPIPFRGLKLVSPSHCVEGFSGLYHEGHFFIHRDDVKAVEFGAK